MGKDTCIVSLRYSQFEGFPPERGLAASCKGSLSGAFATLDITGEGEVSRRLRCDRDPELWRLGAFFAKDFQGSELLCFSSALAAQTG